MGMDMELPQEEAALDVEDDIIHPHRSSSQLDERKAELEAPSAFTMLSNQMTTARAAPPKLPDQPELNGASIPDDQSPHSPPPSYPYKTLVSTEWYKTIDQIIINNKTAWTTVAEARAKMEVEVWNDMVQLQACKNFFDAACQRSATQETAGKGGMIGDIHLQFCISERQGSRTRIHT
mmetsp:Transcript_4544/g.13084  ORF Transcript_4544/g.13084 Transcript_4544/m.13084 type:complete len:178 (-) Transcript_4544:137-670(-)